MPYAIIDSGHGGDLYIHRTWERQSEAEYERAELLYGFPTSSEWHWRLQVVPWEHPSSVRMRKPQERTR